MAHDGFLMLATVAVLRCAGERRRAASALATVAGIALDRRLGRWPAMPWFGPVFYVKLLAGHAGGVLVGGVTRTGHGRSFGSSWAAHHP